jgi:hypothetical protein
VPWATHEESLSDDEQAPAVGCSLGKWHASADSRTIKNNWTCAETCEIICLKAEGGFVPPPFFCVKGSFHTCLKGGQVC